MAIQSTKTTTIPGLAAPSTPDLLAYGIVISPSFPQAGVTAGSMILWLTPYRANVDGTDPQIVGDTQTVPLGELSALAAANPSLASQLVAAKAALDVVVQLLVTARSL